MPLARRFAIVLALLVLAPAAPAAASTESTALARKLARALTVPHVDRSRSSALVVELATGRTIYARNSSLALVPASNEKLAVAHASLNRLGSSFRIETHVLGVGELDGPEWHGDLVLKGYGDPTLSTADLRGLAGQLESAGIHIVAGRIVADETFFDTWRTAPGWKPWYYLNESPALSALTVDRGRFRGRLSRTPALAAAILFKDVLERAGIAVLGPVVVSRANVEAFPLATTASAPLASIVREMGVESDNFTAEILLKQLGALETGNGSTAAGAAVVRRVLAEERVPLAGVRIVDGSGLSRQNRLSANALVGILRAAWVAPDLRPSFVSALPVAGRTGTLRRRMRGTPASGRVLAKTGTTSESSALSGFADGRYAFSVVQNGSPVSHTWARRAQDRFAAVLAAG